MSDKFKIGDRVKFIDFKLKMTYPTFAPYIGATGTITRFCNVSFYDFVVELDEPTLYGITEFFGRRSSFVCINDSAPKKPICKKRNYNKPNNKMRSETAAVVLKEFLTVLFPYGTPDFKDEEWKIYSAMWEGIEALDKEKTK